MFGSILEIAISTTSSHHSSTSEPSDSPTATSCSSSLPTPPQTLDTVYLTTQPANVNGASNVRGGREGDDNLVAILCEG